MCVVQALRIESASQPPVSALSDAMAAATRTSVKQNHSYIYARFETLNPTTLTYDKVWLSSGRIPL